jgi:hypothetical protein
VSLPIFVPKLSTYQSPRAKPGLVSASSMYLKYWFASGDCSPAAVDVVDCCVAAVPPLPLPGAGRATTSLASCRLIDMRSLVWSLTSCLILMISLNCRSYCHIAMKAVKISARMST